MIRVRQIDYFAFTEPKEGGVAVEGKRGTLVTAGYVTTFGINWIRFEIDSACRGHGKQTSLEIE